MVISNKRARRRGSLDKKTIANLEALLRRLNVDRALRLVKDGETLYAFEAAKWLTKLDKNECAASLLQIGADKRLEPWNRIAATWALGWLKRKPTIALGLIRLVADPDEHWNVRGHAAEALGNHREKQAIPLLRKILLSGVQPGLKVECIFALSKMWDFKGDEALFDPTALAALHAFARQKPTGKAYKELRLAFRNICDEIL